MKRIIFGLACMSLLLSGCGNIQTLESDIGFTNERLNSARSDLTTRIDEANKRVDVLSERVDVLEMKYSKQIKIDEPKECVGFVPNIGQKVYKDISLNEVDNDDFWDQWGAIKIASGVKYVEITVESYSIVGDCVEHINKLGYHSWYKTIEELFGQS